MTFTMTFAVGSLALVLSGCTSTADKQKTTGSPDCAIQKAVDALEKEPFGAIDLGTPSPFETSNVKRIISDPSAVPALVSAISSDQLVKVGYAAYCLELMQAPNGIKAARLKLQSLQDVGQPDYRRFFARNCLSEYIDAVSKLRQSSGSGSTHAAKNDAGQ